jgi:hypothetical protein
MPQSADGALMHPAERPVQSLLGALSPAGERRLIGLIQRESKRRNLYYKKKYSPFGMVPFVIDRRTASTLGALAASIFRFQLKAPALYRDDYQGFAGLVRLERRTQAWFDRGWRDPQPWELIIRPDFALAAAGGAAAKPVLFELNSLMLGGIYMHSVIREVMDRELLPEIQLPARRLGLSPSADNLDYLRAWLGRCRERSGHTRGVLAMLESLPPGGGFSELPDIAAAFRKAGVRALHGDPRELELRRGEVCLRGEPVGYVYRDFSFEDAGGPGNRRLKLFSRLWDEGRVSPGLGADFDQKGILECFTSPDFEPLFTRGEVRRLRAHVPWTRVISERRTQSPEGRRVDLCAYVLKNQDRLVLKPSWSSGGDGIVLGWKSAAGRWRRLVEKGLKTPGSCAVQAYIDVPRRETTYLRDGKVHRKACRNTLGVFFDGESCAYHARVSTKDIVNVAQGGAMSAVYIKN